jgi:hypothetical protein
VTRSILSFAATFAMELAREQFVTAGRRALGMHKLEQRVAELESALDKLCVAKTHGGFPRLRDHLRRAS